MWILCHRNSITKTLEYPDGQVLGCDPSLQPEGKIGAPYHLNPRKHDTQGPYEKVEVNGGLACYNPVGEPVVYLFVPAVPNTPGLSAIWSEPVQA